MQENYIDFQIGNWVIYLPERNYCTMTSISPYYVLEGVLQDYRSMIYQIGKIKITEDKLQVCGFQIYSSFLIKYFNNNDDFVAIGLSTLGVHKLYKNDKEFCDVEFIHEVQNAYYKITGEFLRGNLYGVREG